jgi:MYXO-CTERM domain-containing protein
LRGLAAVGDCFDVVLCSYQSLEWYLWVVLFSNHCFQLLKPIQFDNVGESESKKYGIALPFKQTDMKTFLSIAILAASSFAANAATVVVSTTRGGSGDQANMSSQAGQTFTTSTLGSDTQLSSIDLVGPNTGVGADPLGPFTVKVWTDTDGDATTWDPGSLVASSISTIVIPTGNGNVTANFSSGTLADNTVYAFSFASGATDHATFRMGLTASATNGPLGTSGKLFHLGGNPSFGDNRELAFTVTTVPEPATGLLGLAALGLVLRRRRG